MRTERSVLTACGLQRSVERIDQQQDTVHLRFGPPDASAASAGEGSRGWHHCADLLADPSGFPRWHDTLRRWLLDEYGEAPDRTAAGYIKSWYLNVPAFLAAFLFHHERRVPSLRPADLSLRIATDGRPHPDGIALHTAEFACLPDDRAAGLPEATVVDSERGLVELLRARFVAHAARFVAAYRPPVHFGRHTLWAAATDAIDVALWKAGKLSGDEGAGVADAALVLPDAIKPFTSASTLHAVCGEDGSLEWTRRKESCCFSYLLTKGKGECATCPRLSPPLGANRNRTR